MTEDNDVGDFRGELQDSDFPQVREENGVLVLIDPVARGVMRAVSKQNCKATYMEQFDRVEHFLRRARELGCAWESTAIVLLNMDDPFGGLLGDELMPGQQDLWAEIRATGAVPFARGLATRGGVEDFLRPFDPEAADKLASAKGPVVVVVDHQVAEIFDGQPVT